MAKIERGRISGSYGMNSHTSEELLLRAGQLEARKTAPDNPDDPRWLQRQADKMRRLAKKKEKAKAHKDRRASLRARESSPDRLRPASPDQDEPRPGEVSHR